MRSETPSDWLIIAGALILTSGIVVSMAASTTGGLAFLGRYMVGFSQALAIFVLVLGAVVVVFSAARRTSPGSGLMAVAMIAPIWLTANLAVRLGSSLASDYLTYLFLGNALLAVIPIVLTLAIVAGSGYRWGASWLLFMLGVIGCFFVLWRSGSQREARGRQEASSLQHDYVETPRVRTAAEWWLP